MQISDGPSTHHFRPIPFTGNITREALRDCPSISERMAGAITDSPQGDCVGRGIPFAVGDPLLLQQDPLSISLEPFRAGWLVFMHCSDIREAGLPGQEPPQPRRGEGQLNEPAAVYGLRYEDGSQARLTVRRRHQIGMFARRWGENCFQAFPFPDHKPVRPAQEQTRPDWGISQTRITFTDCKRPWTSWLWAWENPRPDLMVTALTLEPCAGASLLLALTAGDSAGNPLVWRPRRKALLTLPGGTRFLPDLDENGLLAQVRLDMGQVISALPRPVYPLEGWESSHENQQPEVSEEQVLVEYTSHAGACFHLWDGSRIAVADVEGATSTDGGDSRLQPVSPAARTIRLRVIDKTSRRAVPARLHVHGAAGEYLAPLDRHRIVNPSFFEDYSVDSLHGSAHQSTYIPGETILKVPEGRIFVEVTRGFEIRPVRRVVEVDPGTDEVVIELEKVLDWRERGWVTADTHVHFLSPLSALLEGAGEGVNVVNLLASQWGELMTNVGDFDGRTTWGSTEAGGDGEHLVRVGTENRQQVLGHISLLGYQGGIIAPMTTGGPDESAFGDPVESLLTEWAGQCRAQGGIVVVPHFPEPRAEHAAAIVSGLVDAVEMTSWEDRYAGIDPYSLLDWYRYLNCGYHVPAVGGTDKMGAGTAVGTVRTYARLEEGQTFNYAAWMDAVRRGQTFVTYGPLMDLAVEGQPMGGRLALPRGGGTLDVVWQAASVGMPMTRVELIVNGEVRESRTVDSRQAGGTFSLRLERSSWLALLVRGCYPGRPEVISVHSSAVMAEVADSALMAAADAVSILEQIEGALAYIDTIGTRAEDRVYRRMRMALVSAQRRLHNRMHRMGHYHEHSPGAAPEGHSHD